MGKRNAGIMYGIVHLPPLLPAFRFPPSISPLAFVSLRCPGVPSPKSRWRVWGSPDRQTVSGACWVENQHVLRDSMIAKKNLDNHA